MLVLKHKNIMNTVYPPPNSRTRILPKSCIYFPLPQSPTSHPQAHHFKWNMALVLMYICLGFPGDASGKEPSANAGDIRRGLDPWVGKNPWRRSWQPTPVSLHGEFHAERSLRATVHGVTKSQTQLRRLSTHMHLYLFKSPIVCLCLFCALCEWRIAFCHLPLPSQHNIYYLSTICIAVVHFLCHYHVALCGYAQVIDLFSCWWPLGLLLVFHCCRCYCRHCSDLIYASGIQMPSENISLGCRVRNAFTGLEDMWEFNLSRWCQTIFQSGCAILHLYQLLIHSLISLNFWILLNS